MEILLPMPRSRLLNQVLFWLMLLIPLWINAEERSLWVMPWSLTSASKIDSIIRNAVESGHTELLLEVRYRSDALYTTNRRSSRFHNPEPRSYVLPNDGFDPLAYALAEAHKQNLKVQAWVVVLNATTTSKDRIAENYIYKNHNSWISHDNSGKKMLNADQYGYYIDPGIPEVQDYLIEVLSDLVDGYPELDGLHLDYIRYPNASMGFHPTSRARFEEYKQTMGELSWNEWRQLNVTTLVANLYTRIKEINPRIMLSAAVIANYNEAVNLYAQAWEEWLREGIIDRIYPMLYNIDNDVFERNLQRIALMPRHQDIIMGLRAWNANGNSLASSNRGKRNTYTISDVKHKIDLVRKIGFGGISLFSYESLMLDNALFDLAAIAYPPSLATVYPPGLSIEPVRLEKQNTPVISIKSADSTFVQPKVTTTIPKSVTHAIIDVSEVKCDVIPQDGKFVINLDLPSEGRWKWEVRTSENFVLYQRYRYYLKGDNIDYWSGVLDSGDQIQPGVYTVHLYQEGQKSKILPFIWQSEESNVQPQ